MVGFSKKPFYDKDYCSDCPDMLSGEAGKCHYCYRIMDKDYEFQRTNCIEEEGE